MFSCGCCGRMGKDDSNKIKRSLEDKMDKRFGDSFEGKNPQERQNNAKKHCDDILEHVKKDDFKVSDIKKKIKPPPVFIASSTYDGK